ncbi:MAG: alpha/beta hydrolase [Sphingobacteriales bacterium JAD_PAG50586_3]|nr:MAG: alpha/beta hydrolase [Sphingobacteriales bacterium JAD_PAG50586_3]
MHTLTSWQQAGKYYNHNGNKVFYIEEGAGEAIVFLHGYPTASYDWKHIWDGLKANYKLIALDFLGFGFSDKPVKYPYSIIDQANIVTDLLMEIGVQKFHLIAHDYAVSVAQEFMARQKANRAKNYTILSVCLLNGGLFPELHRPVLMQKLLLSPLGPLIGKLFTKKRFAKSFGQVFAPDKRPSDAEMDDFWQLIQYNNGKVIIHKLLHYIADRKANRDSWVGATINPPMPVLLINGSLDPVSGKHLADGYRSMVKNPNIVELPTTGHYPQVESPAEVLKAIKGFLLK